MKPLNLNFLLLFLNSISTKKSLRKLKTNSLVLVTASLISLLGIIYSITSSLLLNNIKLAEEKNVHQTVQEVLHEYTRVADDLYYTNLPWSKWDDSYEFVQNPQPAYIQDNFSSEIFPGLNFNLVVLFNKNSKIILAEEWDNQAKKILSIPPVFATQIEPKNAITQYPISGKSITGVILLPKGITIISSLPILDSAGQKPSRGGLLFGRYIQKSELIKRMSGNDFLTVSIDLHTINEGQMPPDFEEARLTLSDKNSIVVQNLNTKKIAGYTWLKDIYGKPILLMRVVKDRELYLQGKNNSSYLLVSLIFVGLIFGIAAQLLIQKIITFQLKRQESEARYRIVVGQASESIFLVDAETKRFLEANAAFEKLLGYSIKELLNLTIDDVLVVENESRDRYLHYIATKTERFTGEEQYRSRDDYFVDVEVNANLISYGEKQVFCHVVRDITERKQAEAALKENEQRLTWQANHDALTGLVNRRKFEQHLEQALNSAKVTKSQHSLCYLDLDRFKIVNDTCGHIAGDELLRQVTALLQSQIRPVDILARLGGDEFALLLDRCTVEQSLSVANALRESIQSFRFVWEDKTFSIGVSIGIVAINNNSQSLINTINSADSACYTAKNQGRDRVQIYQGSDRAT